MNEQYLSFWTYIGNSDFTGLVFDMFGQFSKVRQDDLYPALCESENAEDCNMDTIGDGWCDGHNNRAICSYDGGDCCQGEGRGFACGEDSLVPWSYEHVNVLFSPSQLYSGCQLPEDFVQPCNNCHAETCTCHTTKENYCSGYLDHRVSCNLINC